MAEQVKPAGACQTKNAKSEKKRVVRSKDEHEKRAAQPSQKRETLPR